MKSLVLLVVCFVFPFFVTAINPTKEYYLTPDSLGIKYIDSYISTKDSCKIHEWELVQKNDSSEIIIFVGSDAGNMAMNLFCAKPLVEKGYRIILFDYRGFGSSGSFKTEKNVLFYAEFVSDLQAVLYNIKKKYPKAKVGMLAQSMGTIITTLLTKREKLDFIIFDGLVSSPNKTCDHVYNAFNKKVFCPTNYDEINFQNCLAKIDIPMFIFQGKFDKVCIAKDTKEYVAKNRNRKILIYKGNHLEGFSILTRKDRGDIYTEKINYFIKTL